MVGIPPIYDFGDGGSYCFTNIKGSGQVCIRNLWLHDGPLRNLGRTGPMALSAKWRFGAGKIHGQSIGLKENLQETRVFTIKYGVFL